MEIIVDRNIWSKESVVLKTLLMAIRQLKLELPRLPINCDFSVIFCLIQFSTTSGL